MTRINVSLIALVLGAAAGLAPNTASAGPFVWDRVPLGDHVTIARATKLGSHVPRIEARDSGRSDVQLAPVYDRTAPTAKKAPATKSRTVRK